MRTGATTTVQRQALKVDNRSGLVQINSKRAAELIRRFEEVDDKELINFLLALRDDAEAVIKLAREGRTDG